MRNWKSPQAGMADTRWRNTEEGSRRYRIWWCCAQLATYQWGPKTLIHSKEKIFLKATTVKSVNYFFFCLVSFFNLIFSSKAGREPKTQIQNFFFLLGKQQIQVICDSVALSIREHVAEMQAGPRYVTHDNALGESGFK